MRKKIMYGFFAVLTFANIMTFSITASDLSNIYINIQEIQPMVSDTIVIKYREYNGKLQYRRWNQTKNCWVDSDWIDL